MIRTIFLPNDVITNLAPVVTTIIVPTRVKKLAAEFYRVVLPPASPLGIAWACDLLVALHPAGFEHLHGVALAIRAALGDRVPPQLPAIPRREQTGLRYPVFYGLKKLHSAQATLHTRVDISVVSGFYLALCTRAFDTKRITSNVYYFDVLSLRDALVAGIEVLGLGRTDCRSMKTLQNALIENSAHYLAETGPEALREQPLHKVPRSFGSKLARVRDLITDCRQFGSPRYEDRPGPGGPRGPNSPTVGSREAAFPTEQPGRLDILSTEDDGLALADGATCEVFTIPAVAATDSTDTHDALPGSLELVVERRTLPTGSRLTPRDDLRALRSWFDAYQSKGVISYTDVHRLSLSLAGLYLATLIEDDPLALTFVWLLLTTGLTPNRLKELIVLDHGRRPHRRTGVFLDPERSELSYELLNGPTDFHAPSENAPSDSMIVRVPVPYQIAKRLRTAGNERPYLDIEQRLQRIERNFSRHHAGPAPTARAFAASFWTLVVPNGLTDIEAAFLCGDVPCRLGGPVNYYRLERAALHHRFVAAVRVLMGDIIACEVATPALRDWVTALKFPPAPTGGYVGSQVAAPPDKLGKLKGLFLATATRMVLYNQELRVRRDDEQIALLVEAINLENVQLYTLSQLGTCVRPIGEVAVMSFSGTRFGVWVQDKGSSAFKERSLSPLPAVLAAQLDCCRADATKLHRLCERLAIRVVDGRRADTEQMSAVYELDVQKRELTVSTMTGTAYARWMGQLGLTRYQPPRSNFLRHSLASRFHNDIPGPILDQMMGHHRQGLDVLAPWSSAAVSSFFAGAQDLLNYIKALNPTVLSLEDDT